MISHKVFLGIFAGTAPVAQYMASKGYATLALDLLDGHHGDVGRPAVLDTLLGWMRSGKILGLWCATPCVTLTQARRENDVGMPRPLRDRGNLWGRPALTDSEHEQVRLANILIKNAARLLNAAAALGIPAGEENPRTSLLWQFSSRKRLMARFPAVHVDFCCGGGPVRKRTRLLFINCGSPDPTGLQCSGTHGVCSFSGQRHLHLGGKAHGAWMTKKFEPYPREVAAYIGQAMLNAVHYSAIRYLNGISQ